MEIKLLNYLVLLFFAAQCFQVSCLETEVNEAFFIYRKWQNITEYFTSGSTKGFLSYQELQDYLHQIRKNFPNVVLGIEPIGKTVENRDIRAIHIGLKKKDSLKDNSDKSAAEQKPSILFNGFLSGSDFMSTAMIVYLINYLLYENLHGNTDIQYLLQNRDIWMIPAINGDAYNFISNYFEEHNRTTVVTKNRKNNDPNGICGDFAIGVDLTRNFDAFFDGVDIISRVNGDYTKQEDYVCKPFYRGIKPFSEPETLTIREFLNKRDFQLAINFVGKGNMFLTPYNYDTSLNNAALKEKIMYKTIQDECPFPPGIKFGSRYQVLEETNHGEISDYMLSKKNIIAGSYGLGVGDVGYEENLPTPVKARRILKENLDAAIYFIQKAGVNFRIEELMQGRCQENLPECPESDIPGYVFRLRVSNTGLKSSEKTNLLISFGTNNIYDLQQVSVLDQDGNRKVTGLGIIIDESKKIFQIEVPPLAPGSYIEVSPVLIKSSLAGNEAVEDVPQSMIAKLKDYPATKLSRYEGLILEPNFDINQANEQTYKRNMLITIALIVISCWIAFGGCGYALIKHFKGGKSTNKFRKLHDESMQDAEGPVKAAKRVNDSDIRHRDTANEDERSDRRSKKRGGSKSKSKSKSKSGSRSKDEKKKAKEDESSEIKARKVPKTQDQSNGSKRKQ